MYWTLSIVSTRFFYLCRYAIAACAKAGETAAAEGLLRELRDAGVAPDPRAYNQVRSRTRWGRWTCLIALPYVCRVGLRDALCLEVEF